MLAEWLAAVEAGGARATMVSAYADDPYLAIIAAVKEQGCDLVVMASHGRPGMAALMLGSVTQKGADAFSDPGARRALRLRRGA